MALHCGYSKLIKGISLDLNETGCQKCHGLTSCLSVTLGAGAGILQTYSLNDLGNALQQ